MGIHSTQRGKENILRICIGLELSQSEAEELLQSAGYFLSNAIMTDVIVKYFLNVRRYRPLEINLELLENNTPALFDNYKCEQVKNMPAVIERPRAIYLIKM